MIPLEDKVLPGLDEFMLRLGHLKVICGVASQGAGSILRLEKEVGQTLTRFVPVTSNLCLAVADYLRNKELCTTSKSGQPLTRGEGGHYRYPELVVECNDTDDPIGIRTLDEGVAQPLVWWQDLCLASPGVQSRVGAITVEGKSGSKTGVSHLSDWALSLDLVSKSGELAAEGHLIVALGGVLEAGEWKRNPYLLGTERLVLAYLHFASDIDLFSRFAPKLLKRKPPILKSAATEAFIETVQEIAAEAEEARYLSSNQQFRLFQHARELDSSGKRGHAHKVNSTAWHRASSRVETYVDLGLLDKGMGGEAERFRYVYHPNETLRRVVDSLQAAKSGQEWLEELMVTALFGGGLDHSEPSLADLRRLLPRVVAGIGRPPSSLPIVAVALGVAWLMLEEGTSASLGSCRRGLEEFARTFPEAARLSRGSYGERAEFISFDMRRVVE